MGHLPILTSVVPLVFLCSAIWGQSPVPMGAEFQINSYTTGQQRRPDVAVAIDGDFVVTWSSGGYPSSAGDISIQARMFAANGTPLSSEFQVDSYTTGTQRRPSVAVASNGDFVVVWASDGSEGTDTWYESIQSQRFTVSGDRLGNQIQINSYTTRQQSSPSVAVSPTGGFVVVWRSDGWYGTDTWYESIQSQRFDSDGNVEGVEFQVNTYTTFIQTEPVVGIDGDGNFVVVWSSLGSSGSDSSEYSIQAQRFDADGDLLGSQFQVNSYTTGMQALADVSVEPEGSFVVVWNSDHLSEPYLRRTSVQGQQFDSDGNPIGGEFLISSASLDKQWSPSVSVDARGDFVVAWLGSDPTDTDDYASIQSRSFDGEGNSVGGQIQVNTYTTNNQVWPSIGTDFTGNFVIVWQSDGSLESDDSSTSVQGRLFTQLLFADGFESGDTSAWSSTR